MMIPVNHNCRFEEKRSTKEGGGIDTNARLDGGILRRLGSPVERSTRAGAPEMDVFSAARATPSKPGKKDRGSRSSQKG